MGGDSSSQVWYCEMFVCSRYIRSKSTVRDVMKLCMCRGIGKPITEKYHLVNSVRSRHVCDYGKYQTRTDIVELVAEEFPASFPSPRKHLASSETPLPREETMLAFPLPLRRLVFCSARAEAHLLHERERRRCVRGGLQGSQRGQRERERIWSRECERGLVHGEGV